MKSSFCHVRFKLLKFHGNSWYFKIICFSPKPARIFKTITNFPSRFPYTTSTSKSTKILKFHRHLHKHRLLFEMEKLPFEIYCQKRNLAFQFVLVLYHERFLILPAISWECECV